MQKKKDSIDIIDKILEACYQHNKDALFTMSLMHQYEERGWLTKNQMKGLLDKAKKIKYIPTGLLATLEATIAKLPTKDKTPIVVKSTIDNDNKEIETLLTEILQSYPQHKTVIGLQSIYNKNKTLAPAEITALKKFHLLLIINKKK